jgi:FAD:protein FMN transferase
MSRESLGAVILAGHRQWPYICHDPGKECPKNPPLGAMPPIMPQSSRFAIFLVAMVVASLRGLPVFASDDFAFYHENVLGTSLALHVRCDSEEAARRAEACVLGEIDRLAAIFSGYDPGSEFSRWQAAPKASVPVSAALYDVLLASESWRVRSGGAFDTRAGVYSRLWTGCAQLGRLPTESETRAAKEMLKTPAWRLVPMALLVERLSDCPVSLDGIAKGYIVEQACEKASREHALVRGLVLNVGGDLRVRGQIDQTIGIAAPWADSESSEPLIRIAVKDKSVSTSGNSQRGFTINGKWYSHIFDPRSGLPVDRVRSATVVADRGVDADALAKVCGVLEPDESVRLINSLAGVDCLILTADGRVAKSAGWHALERPAPVTLALAAQQDGGLAAKASANPGTAESKATLRPDWDSEFELVVNFEINRPDDEKGRYRRPYVAVWVEDGEGMPVRTLALWVSMGGSGPFQWLPDLKRWFKSEQDRKAAEKKDIFFTVSRPTRPPGKYKVIWDGKDNHGKQLPGGDYTLTVEAAREHGTYQSMRKQITLSNKPFTEDLKGNVEIRSASIEYRRKAAAK